MSWPLRGDHEDINGGRRHDLPKVNVETMSERQIGSRLQIRCHVLSIDGGLRLIWRQNHHDIRRLHRIGNGHNFESALLSFFP